MIVDKWTLTHAGVSKFKIRNPNLALELVEKGKQTYLVVAAPLSPVGGAFHFEEQPKRLNRYDARLDGQP